MTEQNATQSPKTDQELTEVLLKEEKIYNPSEEVKQKATVKNWEEAQAQALENPEAFWEEAAKELEWEKPWKKVLDESKKPFFTWFKGAKGNIFFNALERHQKTAVKNKIAYIAENERGEKRTLTYGELYQEVNKLAGAFQKLGLKKGDRVTVYLPNMPEVAMTMLACAKLGAIHSVVYAGFSFMALRDRIQDAGSKIVVTSDGILRRGKAINLKDTIDKAVAEGCPSVQHVVVVRHTGEKIEMKEGRDHWFDEISQAAKEEVKTEVLKTSDPLFILYTSGTTAKPKGVVHDHGGYMVGVNRTIKWVFDLKEDDIYWCTADPGWITGHSYIIYGPLMAGVTSIMYEGVPDYPQNDHIWEIVERNKVTILYTAPTLVRMMMKYGEEPPKKHDLSSLRLLGSVGEPINPEAWRWFHQVIGQERCPIMDTWWQTETGMFMVCPLPVTPLKAGSATKPFPGIKAAVVDKEGKPVPVGKGGFLIIENSWPAMLTTLWQNPKRYKETYWEKIPGGYYTTGDVARIDQDGYYWLQGRADDVMNISGHRIGTAEIESALASHEAVVEAGVIGKPHPVKGESAKAFVILKQGFAPSDELIDSLRKQVRTVLGPIAIVEEISFVDKLPKTRSGKIMRRVLKAQELGLPLGDISTLED
ncbi:MAG: acetate--CoA ligase [Candidatus Kerfeldbacteria bacterium CG_4_10_14_0_8_um_filter_42_10]|uniref:Acetate--CoA ligase n=1 Tax=Candidatus Kerfeldbacteria bacterium CG_4_10_14_0_8_um_filter_42_10 TaxID=2014248 RepID=A0A2M7RG28_9BACT|nr:MAG: acetate--CoA ligase [Candidatus Kerfeldbacteria bacterium CG_4_10_14_0_8_um_filter_42_10]